MFDNKSDKKPTLTYMLSIDTLVVKIYADLSHQWSVSGNLVRS